MGFIPETISAPSVPDGLDPLKYLTAKDPESKAQETAQANARQLAHGPTELENQSGIDDTLNLNIDSNQQKNLQDSKSTRFTINLDRKRTMPIEYPYFYSISNKRTVFSSMTVDGTLKSTMLTREKSIFGKVQGPTFILAEDEMAMGPAIINKIAPDLEKYGIVKLVMPGTWYPQMLPFNFENAVFKPHKQVVLDQEIDLREAIEQMSGGMFRAIIRFHTASPTTERKVTKLPTYERKPVDLYRLYCAVQRRGGYDDVTKRKEWAQVGRDLGYSSISGQTLSSNIRITYMRLVHPFRKWLTDQLKNDVDFEGDTRVLPRMDVLDPRFSNKILKTWKKLQYDIVVEKPKRPTSIPKSFDRYMHSYSELETQTSFSYPKQFRFTELRLSSGVTGIGPYDINELEKSYSQLPQFFCMEKSPDLRLHPFSANMEPLRNARQGCLDVVGATGVYDPWDFMEIAYRNNQIINYVEDEINDLILPQINFGGQYSTFTNDRPLANTYLASLLVEGSGRTWYTENGTWIDQGPREIVIVNRGVSTTNWSHGYSAQATVNILNSSNWIPSVIKKHDEVDNIICVPRLIFSIVKRAQRLSEELIAQLLDSINILHKEEIHNLEVVRQKVKDTMQCANPEEVVECSETSQKLFLSWVVVSQNESEGAILSVKQFLKNPVPNATFISKYGDNPTGYFETLRHELDSKDKVTNHSWTSELISTLRDPNNLPKISKLWDMTKFFPVDKSLVVYALRTALKNSSNLIEITKQKDPGHTLDDMYLAEADDENNVVANAINKLNAESIKLEQKWNSLEETIDAENTDAAGILLSEFGSSNFKLPFSRSEVVEKLKEVSHWIEEASKAVAVTSDTPARTLEGTYLRNLQAAENFGNRLGITSRVPLMKRVQQKIREYILTTERMKSFIYSIDVLNPWSVKNIAEESADWMIPPNPDSERSKLMKQLNGLVHNLPLIERMHKPAISERPKNSEMVRLATLQIPSINALMNSLQEWIAEATRLDWIAIASQVSRITQKLPPDPEGITHSLISVSSIVDLCRNLQSQRIVCDDIDSVQNTLLNALRVLNTVPQESLHLYGFCP